MDPLTTEHMDRLHLAEPKVAGRLSKELKGMISGISPPSMALLVEDTIWGLSQEESFGRAICDGYITLLKKKSRPPAFETFSKLIRLEGREGPTMGRIMASAAVPVLVCDDPDILGRFLAGFKIMKKRGSNMLPRPFQALAVMLHDRDLAAARAYLDLLHAIFTQCRSYSQCRQFSEMIPRAVMSFPASKRVWQTRELIRLVRVDLRLVDPFVQGMDKSLFLLTESALTGFVSLGLEKYPQYSKFAGCFFSLESRSGIEACKKRQVAVSLQQVRTRLMSYLQARTGRAVLILPVSEIESAGSSENDESLTAGSDGRAVYLPEVIDKAGTMRENMDLFQCLTRFESGYYEFGTFDFDLDRLADRSREYRLDNETGSWPGKGFIESPKPKGPGSDLNRFIDTFPDPKLAWDLFLTFEHARIRVCFSREYPGLIKKYLPLLQIETQRMRGSGAIRNPLFDLYTALAMALEVPDPWIHDISKMFLQHVSRDDSVETTAMMVLKAYHRVEDRVAGYHKKTGNGFQAPGLRVPFNRTIFLNGHLSHRPYEKPARDLWVKLRDQGIQVYRSDIRKTMELNHGRLSRDDIEAMIVKSGHARGSQNAVSHHLNVDLSGLDLSRFIREDPFHGQDPGAGDSISWHREWDEHMGDYLDHHVRVNHRKVSHSENSDYWTVLRQNQGLVKDVRHSFELLKPEGLKMLRQWIDGDEFDYRALIDYSIDVKSGRTPSERLYVKRIKQQRDVSVLLLVDLSRSTANIAMGTLKPVIHVEKEALVLFSEALNVVGDSFSIAGFSGTGRLGVDYFLIKDFHENLNDRVKNRIGHMSPQRSTRMGAAIREAGRHLDRVNSKVRLLIILGDGFPNDTGYKQGYAIADTRKAISELRADNIHVHAITVNVVEDPKLDQLYSHIHHNVISDVSELPSKLIRIYSHLTR